jgi:hypothetical protein
MLSNGWIGLCRLSNNMDEESRAKSVVQITRWEAAFSLLSMERVEPFVAAMGLRVSDIGMMRGIARQFLEQFYSTPNEDTDMQQQLLRQAIAEIANRVNEQTLLNVNQWMSETFAYGSQTGLFRWARLLKWLAGIGGKAAPPDYPSLERGKLRKIVLIVREGYKYEALFERKLEDVETEPRSDWDERIYSRFEPGNSPLDSVRATIEDNCTQNILRKIRVLFTQDELDAFLFWARDQAVHLNMKADWINMPLLGL